MGACLKGVLATATLFVLASAHPARAADGPRPLFAANEVLSLILTGPLQQISRKADAEPVPGVLTVGGAAPETLPVNLSVRGITRRRDDICSFPPLRVEFTQQPPPTSIFRGQKRLKLVTHCQRLASYEQYLLLEYTAYRLYRAMTPDSFNVRLAQIEYHRKDGQALITRFGFFIEDIDDVAKRNGHKRLRGVGRISPTQLNATEAARFAVFEYMISNLDWAMTAGPAGEDCCHNARLLRTEGKVDPATGLIPVPYDFDYAGLVNAPYAAPPQGVPVVSVRVRRYRGFCAQNAEAEALLTEMSTRSASLMAIVDEFPQLKDSTRREADSYLHEFFEQVGSPSKIAGLLKTCLH